MKVMLVNGSPHEHGCTDAALREAASALNDDGIDTEIFWIGNTPIGGCIACGGCSKAGKCVFGGSSTTLPKRQRMRMASCSERLSTMRRPPAI